MQLGLALLTEAILMFYWFFDLFFSAPASIYTLSLYLRHEEQANPSPRRLWSRSLCVPIRPCQKQGCRTKVLMMIVGGVWFWLTSSFSLNNERSSPLLQQVSKKDLPWTLLSNFAWNRKKLELALRTKQKKEEMTESGVKRNVHTLSQGCLLKWEGRGERRGQGVEGKKRKKCLRGS